jgi:hypothetical protein
MAIVKARYVRGKDRIKAHLRYITHRRGEEGERMTRPLFGRDGALSKQQIYEMIDKARRGAVFHKFVINFHPVKEDTRKDLNLWELTRKTLEQIKTQFGDSVPFVATIHDDHTLLRHIHGFFIVEGKLNKEEFAKIKKLWKVGECRCETSGCNRPVNTAAMGAGPACPPTCLNVLSANNGSRTAGKTLCTWEGGCTADVQTGIQIAVPGDQLARCVFRFFEETLSWPPGLQT